MKKIIDWIKNNKLTTVFGLIVLYFLYNNFFGVSLLGLVARKSISPQYYGEVSNDMAIEMGAPAGVGALKAPNLFPPPRSQAPPTTDVEERLVVRETNLSLVVEDVRTTSDTVLNYVDQQGGYMVSTSITQPEEAPFGTIVVRVPSDTLRETMDYLRSLATKVSSEHVTGRDVTDAYEDIEARLVTLEKTKARFEEIMDKAIKIDDILRVQREIINLQRQIDNLKGRQQLLEGTARLSKITIYISSDEIALPYTPSETFRPNVILKFAVRSLVRNLRKIASAAIWLVVYSVIWVPVLGVILIVKRWKAKKAAQQQQQQQK